MSDTECDVKVVNHGSLFQFYLLTEAAKEWWTAHVPDEGFQWSTTSKVVEPRYARDIATGMQTDGLEVR